MMRPRRTIAAPALAVAAADIAFAGDLIAWASVIDGDTIEIHSGRIRLFGVDTPESSQTCEADRKPYRYGEEAALALSDKIGKQTVSCDARDKDRYGRIVAVCSVKGEDLQAWLVAQGWALAYRRYATNCVDEEETAKEAKRGVWRGQFVPPWDWRRGTCGDSPNPRLV